MNMFRYWTICLILAGTAAFLHYREGPDRQVAREQLSNFPIQMAGRTATDQPIDAETLEVLGAGDFLSRVYSSDESAEPISLFIGYFPDPENRHDHPFAQELPARERVGIRVIQHSHA